MASHWCNKRKDALYESLAWWYMFIWIKMMRMHEGVREGWEECWLIS